MFSVRSALPVSLTGRSRALALLLVAGLFVTFAAGARTVQAQDAGQPFFYSAGRKNPLPQSTKWAAVQLESSAGAASVEASFRATGEMAQAVSPILHRKKNVLVLPLKQGSVTARNEARTRLAAAKGVKRAVRVFGDGANPVVETDEVLAQFKPGVTVQTRDALLRQYGLAIVENLLKTPNGYLLRVTNPEAGTATECANALYESGQVVYSHPNFIWPKVHRFVPDDALYNLQWHLNNSGQNGGTPGADIKAEAAWNITRGSSSITVAVIDDGIDLGHEDFQGGKLVPGYDFVDNDNDPSPGVGDRHGTDCAGLISANTNNGIGVAGVAPNIKIMPIRLISFGATLQDEHDAFIFAADNGADVISCSWGPQDGENVLQPLPDTTRQGIDYAADNGRGGRGCVIFFAAGNGSESADLDGYSSYTKVISVAASTNDDRHAAYSDFGASVDLAAPGGGQPGSMNITTTDRTGADGYNAGNYDTNFAGTSASCPIAAGVAALALSVNSSLTRAQVQTLMQNNADKVGGAAYVNGRNDEMGYGRVNALRVVQNAATYFTASGKITLSNGTAVAGVTVTASTTGAITTSQADGTWTLQLPAGTTTITPSKDGYVFTPATRTVTVGPNATNLNFTAQGFSVTLIAPATNATVYGTTPLRASTTLDSVVQSMEFARRLPVRSFTRTPNANIPDASPTGTPGVVSDSATVAGTGTASSASISVNITHPYSGDLIIKLYPPGVTGSGAIVLSNREGGNTPNLVKTWDLELANPTLAGTWRLEVTDADNLPTATQKLNSWSMSISPTWVTIATDNDGPSAGEWTASWNTSGTPAGVYDVRARAIRSEGNVDAINTNITVSATPIDSTPPTVTVTTPANNSVVK